VIDTAPNYEDGYSEEVVGRAVRGYPRDRVFVIDKVDDLEAPVGPQIDGSLVRLGLDRAGDRHLVAGLAPVRIGGQSHGAAALEGRVVSGRLIM